jgi:trehalose 6-phosphate phosphatase
LDTACVSLFLDIDGTLLDFADRPESVVVDPSLVRLLADLHRALGGALALVSGRAIDTLDQLFHPFHGTAVGLHGIEVRIGDGNFIARADVPALPGALREHLESCVASFAANEPGRASTGFLEDKGFAIALHHRLDTEAADALHQQLLAACSDQAPGWTVLKGREVLELKPALITKAHGCEQLMQEPPFLDSWPIAFGDDVTDLDMFEAIKRHGGTTVGVGPRIADCSDLQVASPQQSVEMLRSVLAIVSQGGRAAQVLGQLRLGSFRNGLLPS